MSKRSGLVNLLALLFCGLSFSTVANAWNKDDYNWLRYDIYHQGEAKEYSISEFDASGRRIGEKIYAPDGVLIAQITHHYNEQNQLVKSEHFSGTGRLEDVVDASYDAQGYKIREVTTNPQGEPIDYVTYSYDAAGKIATSTSYNNKNQAEYIWQYSHESQKITIRFYAVGNDEIKGTMIHEYDPLNRLSKSSISSGPDADGKVVSTRTYSY